MSCFLQTATGDLDISANGNMTLVTSVAQCTAQKLTNRFSFGLGEWFADTTQGIPYFQNILVQNPNLNTISTIFQRVLKSVPGVAAITELNLDFISTTRNLVTTFGCRTNDGAVLQGGVGVPFVIVVAPTGTA